MRKDQRKTIVSTLLRSTAVVAMVAVFGGSMGIAHAAPPCISSGSGIVQATDGNDQLVVSVCSGYQVTITYTGEDNTAGSGSPNGNGQEPIYDSTSGAQAPHYGSSVLIPNDFLSAKEKDLGVGTFLARLGTSGYSDHDSEPAGTYSAINTTATLQNPTNSSENLYVGYNDRVNGVDNASPPVNETTNFSDNSGHYYFDYLVSPINGGGTGNSTPEAPSAVLIGIGAVAVLAGAARIRRRTATR